jgi:predicted short-subunit dehydrogenase-like oxidoreductase (DUF2520 family)
MGQGLTLALRRSGVPALLWGRRSRAVHRELQLQTGDPAKAIGAEGLLLLAVPDQSITPLAAELADLGTVGPEHTVLHLSGLLDRSALRPLEGKAGGLGSFHPLQAIADPGQAADRWRGAYAAIEGDPAARMAGLALAERLELIPFEIQAEAKPAYHAAATLLSNYVVTLLRTAETIATRAGIAPSLASVMYATLLEGTAANLDTRPPAEALTGPIVRGDVVTVRSHLAALAGAERRLYAELGLATVPLARAAGLAPALADELERWLGEATGR